MVGFLCIASSKTKEPMACCIIARSTMRTRLALSGLSRFAFIIVTT